MQENLSENHNLPEEAPFASAIMQRSGGRFKFVMFIVLVLLIGGGTVLATRVWDPVWSPFRLKSNDVMASMMEKMRGIKTINSQINISLENQDHNSLLADIIVDSDKGSDVNKYSASFSLAIKQAENNISLTGNSIVVGQDGYLKLNNIPFILAPYLGNIQEQWLKYSQELENNKTNEENLKKLQTLFQNGNWYKIESEYADQKIGNVKTYHYLIVLDEVGIKKTFAEFIKQSQGDTSQYAQFEDINFEKIASSILDKIFNQTGEIKAEIWIGKKDFYLYKISMEKNIDLKSLNISSNDVLDLNININFSKFNEPLTIDAPKDFKNLQEIFGGKLPLPVEKSL